MWVVLKALAVVLSLAVLEQASTTPISRGIASMYHPLKCHNGRYAGAWAQLPTEDDLVCAHRTLPFGTVLRLRWSTRSAYCVVLDRGPFGYCERVGGGKHGKGCPSGHRYVVATRLRKSSKEAGWYRGVLDATPMVHRMLRSPGWVVVQVDRVEVGRLSRVLRWSLVGGEV